MYIFPVPLPVMGSHESSADNYVPWMYRQIQFKSRSEFPKYCGSRDWWLWGVLYPHDGPLISGFLRAYRPWYTLKANLLELRSWRVDMKKGHTDVMAGVIIAGIGSRRLLGIRHLMFMDLSVNLYYLVGCLSSNLTCKFSWFSPWSC